MRALGVALVAVSALSVFMALWQAVRERRTDLAMLRMLGAGPGKLAGLLMAEALWLAVKATVLGLLLAQGLMVGLPWLMPTESAGLLASAGWPAELWAVPAVAVGVALLAAALPAWGAYRVDVAHLLQAQG